MILKGRADGDPVIRHPKIPVPGFRGIFIPHCTPRVLDSEKKSLLATLVLIIVVPANEEDRMLRVELALRCRRLGTEWRSHSVRLEAFEFVDAAEDGVPVGNALLPAADVPDHRSNVMQLERWR
jgi:hypothetical protein